MPAKPKAPAKPPLKDPKGGLTAAGRAHFKKTEGANLKPGVKGPADTVEKQGRKGSFLRRHFANPNAGPLTDGKGKPTRHALSAAAWGEPIPTTEAAVKKLADKGTELLDKARAAKGAKPAAKARAAASNQPSTGKKAAPGASADTAKKPAKSKAKSA